MISKWFHLKEKAIKLRKDGLSVREIERVLLIPRSTLSGWFKSIELSEDHRANLQNKKLEGLIKARKKAVIWHNAQKNSRLKIAEEGALKILSEVDLRDTKLSEIALAMLYLGEGFKTNGRMGIGSSNPLILKFFIKVILEIYKVERTKIRCSLHLRADQNPDLLMRFWSKELRIPMSSFTSPSVDMRTKGRATYATYYGVCLVQCGNIALQRRLIYIAKKFCEGVIRNKCWGG